MRFERSEILQRLLDDMAADDSTLYPGLVQKILGQMSQRGMLMSTSTVSLVFQELRNQLTDRAATIVSEMRRVLEGAYIDDTEDLANQLKSELGARLDKAAQTASSSFQDGTAEIRKRFNHPNLPSLAAVSEHVGALKQKWFAEIELFCQKARDNQAPRLFLKAGEVFGGNRAARAIFAGATRSLDIIDTYFGPKVFDMLESTPPNVRIRLISDRADPATKSAYTLFNQQYQNRVEFRLCPAKSIHDRFIIVDERQALHLGHSIKDLGKSDTLIDQAVLDTQRKRFEDLWVNSQPIPP